MSWVPGSGVRGAQRSAQRVGAPAASPCSSDGEGEAGAADQDVAGGRLCFPAGSSGGAGPWAAPDRPQEEHELPGPPLRPSQRIGKSREGLRGDHGHASHVTQRQAHLPVPASGQPGTPHLRILGAVRNGSLEWPHAWAAGGRGSHLGFTLGFGGRPPPTVRRVKAMPGTARGGAPRRRAWVCTDAKAMRKRLLKNNWQILFRFLFFFLKILSVFKTTCLNRLWRRQEDQKRPLRGFHYKNRSGRLPLRTAAVGARARVRPRFRLGQGPRPCPRGPCRQAVP